MAAPIAETLRHGEIVSDTENVLRTVFVHSSKNIVRTALWTAKLSAIGIAAIWLLSVPNSFPTYGTGMVATVLYIICVTVNNYSYNL